MEKITRCPLCGSERINDLSSESFLCLACWTILKKVMESGLSKSEDDLLDSEMDCGS